MKRVSRDKTFGSPERFRRHCLSIAELANRSGADAVKHSVVDVQHIAREDEIALQLPVGPHAAADQFETQRRQELGDAPAAFVLSRLDLNLSKRRVC
jgi:hypothetical protein